MLQYYVMLDPVGVVRLCGSAPTHVPLERIALDHAALGRLISVSPAQAVAVQDAFPTYSVSLSDEGEIIALTQRANHG